MIENEPPSETPDPVGSYVRRSVPWRIAAAAIFAVILLVGLRLSFVDGLLRRVVIDGPSMAPAFCGARYEVQCGDCHFPFQCDAEHVPGDEKAVCPNCGFTENLLAEAKILPAERVMIDRWPLLFRGPRRGEVVAFHSPGSSGELAIKRIAAFSGERLAIRGGELFDAERIIRKSPKELRAVRLLVHDNHYQPEKTKGLPPRWRRAAECSRWRTWGDGFQTEPGIRSDDCDWLEYEHWPCTANAALRGVSSPVTDNDGYNQGELRRPLNYVPDVLLSCHLQTSATGRIVLAAVDGNQRFELLVLPTAPAVLQRDGMQLAVLPIDLSRFAAGAHVEFGLCDQQVLLVVDGKMIARQAYDRPLTASTEPLHPLAIGSIQAEVKIADLKVWRDIYYLDSHGLSRDGEEERALGAEKYFLLGDNQPVSIDSRQWNVDCISRKSILGLVRKRDWRESPH